MSDKSVNNLMKPYTDAMKAIPSEDVEPLLEALECASDWVTTLGVKQLIDEALAAFKQKHG